MLFFAFTVNILRTLHNSADYSSFRPGKGKRSRKLTALRGLSSPSSGVEAEMELEFSEDQPDGLAPLEREVSDGLLANIPVVPKVKAGRLITFLLN